jgi:predicted transcriptional regulator
MTKYEYVIYQGEEIICAGTLKECAAKMGVTEAMVSMYGSKKRQAKMKGKKNQYVAEKVSVEQILKELGI